MSEFQEVMGHLNRYCTTNDGKPCVICDLEEECPFNNSALSMTDETIENLEKKIEKWAAEHPEPVYPTWGTWLAKMTGQAVDEDLLYSPIPAIIAKKLGLKPKEG